MACCPAEAKYGYDDSRFEKAVDHHFHCSVCFNVLKDPVMCRNNEHLFCRDCITEHLNTNSHTCPECNEDLTVETLRRARVISNIISDLKIKCDYSQRGCQESIRLEELDSHVESCGFAPVKCSNEECEMIVNKREIIHHESTVCEYRKVKCHNCGKIEQDVEEMKEKMEEMKEKMVEIDEKMEGMSKKVEEMDEKVGEKIEGMSKKEEEMVEKVEEKIEGMSKKVEEMDEKVEEKIEGMSKKVEEMDEKVEEKMDGMSEKLVGITTDVDDLKRLMVQMFEKLRFLENGIQISSAVNYASTSLMQDILVAGGFDGDDNHLKSVEKFSWKKNAWERVCSMNVGRSGATSFVYENQVFVAGGCGSPVIEVLNLNEDPLQCGKSEATLPFNCWRLRNVVYQGRVILFCACNCQFGNVTELCLTPPYTCKQLCKIPQPKRQYYTVVAFEHKVLIFGGKNVDDNDSLKDVLELDLTTKKIKVMPSLPGAARLMAGVRWGDQAILIGGYSKDGRSKKVLMYDSKTGKTTELPSMLEKRNACAAVITGNTIVVMGGFGESGRVRSVEAFTLGGYSWRYLPAMNDIRSILTATALTLS